MTRLWILPLLAGAATLGCSDDGSSEQNTPDASGSGGSAGQASSSSGGATSSEPDDVVRAPGVTPEPLSLGPVACDEPGAGDTPLIDDVDDLDKRMLSNEGRDGWWEAFDSEEGVFEGKIDYSNGEGQGVDGSGARCVDVSGFTGWGAVISANMGYPRCMYDASAYEGVCFDAKGTFTQGDHLDFSVNTADTLGTPDGGRCDQTMDAESCEKFWHYKTVMHGEGAEGASEGEVVLKNEYQTFCYTWDEMQQDKDTPTPRDFNVEEVVQFEWKWPGGWPTGEKDELGKPINGSTDSSLCIDNLRFMTKSDTGMGGATP